MKLAYATLPPLVLLCLSSWSGPLPAQDDAKQATVFQPEPGVECVRSERTCTDAKGPSFGWTRISFGLDAALALAERERLLVNPDDSTFRIDTDSACDLSLRVCYRELEPDVELTREYFDEHAVERLQAVRRTLAAAEDNVVELGPGVACARSARICYDQGGPSVALTRLGFGNAAAFKLLTTVLHRREAARQDG